MPTIKEVIYFSKVFGVRSVFVGVFFYCIHRFGYYNYLHCSKIFLGYR